MRTRTTSSSRGADSTLSAPGGGGTARAITAIVLCGGRGQRLGGCEKPLLPLGERPLVAHVIDRLAPQTDAIVLACSGLAAASAKRAYRQFGWPIVEDAAPGEGPLAGFAAARPSVETPWTLLAAADTPFLPTDLVARMAPLCHRHGAAVASAGGQRQNLAILLAERQAEALAEFFARGGRAAKHWLDAEGVPTVAFDADAFWNVNTAADLARARQRLDAGQLPASA